jgi:hypothetical protein
MREAMPPLHQHAFIAWRSVKKKHRDNFTYISLDIEIRLFTVRILFQAFHKYFIYVFNFTALNRELETGKIYQNMSAFRPPGMSCVTPLFGN